MIQVDVYGEEMGHNVESSARLVGDCTACVDSLNNNIGGFSFNGQDWIKKLSIKSEKNIKLNEELIAKETFPMTYYNSCGLIKKYLP